MRTAALGRTPLQVSELGLGGASLGNLYTGITDEQAGATVDAAWQAGVRLYDTAPHYGLGLSERRLGAALAQRPREQYVLCTKVGRLLEPNPQPTGSDLADGFAVPDALRRRWDFSASGVHRSLEASLARLGLDRVDIVLVHDADDHLEQAVQEAVPALVALRDQGVVGAVGVGMNAWRPSLRVVERTDVDVVMLAGRYTLLDRSGLPLLDACHERGVAVLSAAPFGSGLLARPWPQAGAAYDYRPASDELLARARALAGVCREHGVELPAAALQFPGRHPAVTSVVAGAAGPDEVSAAAALLAAPLPVALWDRLAAEPRPT